MNETQWGVWLHAVRPLPELAAFAATAEALGAAAILVADEGTDRDLFVTLAALAHQTRKVHLFGAVTNPHSRHPVALAAAFASLAELAPGRIVAGFGAGGTRVFAPLGLTPAHPYTALRECLEMVQALWQGQTVSHVGEFRVNAAHLTWQVTQHIPMALAGRGPRVERLAAERADWFLVAGRTVDTLPGLFQRLRNGSHRPRIAWNPIAAWTDAMREDLRGHLGYMAADMPQVDRPQAITDEVLERYAILGDRAPVAARLAELCERLRPELLVFDAGDYSVKFLESLASVALDAGAAPYDNEVSSHGLDPHD